MDILVILRTMLTQIVTAVVRTGVTVAVTWLTAKQLIDDSVGTQALAIIPIALASIAWSLIEKYVLAKFNLMQLFTARAVAADTPLNEIQRLAAQDLTSSTVAGLVKEANAASPTSNPN